MTQKVSLTYYSDVLCVWAHIAQVRVDEVARHFSDDVSIDYRFCSVFGDTTNKIGKGWADRDGYIGFAKHVRDSAAAFDHVSIHPDVWQRCRPVSSAPAHLVMKAVQRVDPSRSEDALRQIRSAFFERSLDISQRSVLDAVLDEVGVSVDQVGQAIDAGLAHADLEADGRDSQLLMVQGSPTFILNEGRQKLYGNIGYGVIEANINEMLRSPVAGAASWC
jgi:predicted DsbA family dithiol-disulfide isomerase